MLADLLSRVILKPLELPIGVITSLYRLHRVRVHIFQSQKGTMMLEVRDVSVQYGKLTVIDRASFTLNDGRWLMIVGPNGAGKSTLLNVLAQMIPYDGRVAHGR